MSQLDYVITHIFLLPKLPQEDDQKCHKDHALCKIYDHAETFQHHLPANEQTNWEPMLQMLRIILDSQANDALDTEHLERWMKDMQQGDVLALLIHAQNAGVIM
ncbi:hypothetical protein AcW1_002062 [Taiwanofungus camphoratus]|nr:hypothetical protein AcW1_002062 [Antrodia cinnamomea]KAI0945966.1 hypothetical protein AcV7_010068 [Antrodia cinnamomea]